MVLLELFGWAKVHLPHSFMAVSYPEFLTVHYAMPSLKDSYVQLVPFGNCPHFQECGDRVPICADTL